MRWTVVIPVKALPEAKSRLAQSSPDPAGHERLVLAMRADTMAAARAAAGVARILVVADRPEATAPGADVLIVQTRPGLNSALREAAEMVGNEWPDDGIAALVGDLPALQPGELAAALELAAGHARAFVADGHATGTTLLTAGPRVDLEPAFGDGSAKQHSRTATSLAAGSGLRQDVDTHDDLERALELGVGPETRACTSARTLCVHLD